MSAIAAPQITLEQAKQLVAFLENDEQQKAQDLLGQVTAIGQDELFSEVGKLTRQLHDSLKNFQFDSTITALTNESIPDAKERLNYVMEMTEQAANSTMDAVEASLPIADKLQVGLTSIKPKWDKLMARDLEVGEFKALCHELNHFMVEAKTDSDKLTGLMTEVLMAQGYQDLTGQVIRRVIELVREVEDSLIHMLTVFGTPTEFEESPDTTIQEQQQMVADGEFDQVAEGPIIDAESRDDVVSGQDEVDDLLSSLGF